MQGRPHRRVSGTLLAVVSLLIAGGAAAPFAWRSAAVTRARAAYHLDGARKAAAAKKFADARSGFRAALRLQPGDAEARRELAAIELAQGNRDLAWLELQALADMHPEDPRPFVALADLMLENGWLEVPESVLDQAIDAAPQDADAHERRGGIRLRLGRYAGARADAEAAVAAAPKDAGAWVLLARSAARSRGPEAGADAARRGIAAVGRTPALLRVLEAKDLGPEPVSPQRLRADALTRLGKLGAWTREHWPGKLGDVREALEADLKKKDWAAAERTVESARHDYPDTVFPPFLAGTLDLARGKPDDAEKHFLEAKEIAPRFPTVIAALGRTWAWKNGAYGAANGLKALAERDPGLAIARYMAARAYVEARDPVKAEAVLRRGLTLQPDSPIPYQHLTDYYFGLDRTAEALETCQQGLQRFPQAAELQLMLPQIAAALGRSDVAVRAWSDLLAQRPDLDLARYKLAALLATSGDAALRPRLLEVASELRNDAPSDPLLLDALGWVQLKAGNTARARELLEAAVQEAPDDPSIHFHLAALYTEQRNAERARGELKLALDSPRPFPERLDALRMLRQGAPAPQANAPGSSARH